MNPFIERQLDAKEADGKRFEICIRIDAPRLQPDGDWTCQLSITHLFEPPRGLFGVDSWQAMQHSLQIAFSTLEAFVRHGGQLFHKGSQTLVSPADLFVPMALRARI